MAEPPDLEFQQAEPPPPYVPPPYVPHVHDKRAIPKRAVAAVALLAVAAGIAWYFFGRQTAAPEAPVAVEAGPVSTPPPSAQALCQSTGADDLPALDQTDGMVGKLVGGLSSHPRVTAWLASDNRIRNFTVVVENIANGETPTRHLRSLRPSGTFRAIDKNADLLVDPRSYQRYAPLAAAVDSIDAPRAAQLCAFLKPRIEEAYKELGREGTFDRALERAIVAMLQTPVLEGDVRLVPIGAVYGFEDESLEHLTAAQKHLARMGPANVRIIQAKLRQIALAIGIPAERLPQ